MPHHITCHFRRTLAAWLANACLLLPVVHVTHGHNPATCHGLISGNVYVRKSDGSAEGSAEGSRDQETLNESAVLNTVWVWKDSHHKEGV